MTTRQPSQTAIATRSLRLAMQLTDPQERSEALRRHAELVWGPKTCSHRPRPSTAETRSE